MATMTGRWTASRTVLLVIAVTAVARMAAAALTGLGYDEAYMVTNAREFSLSYVDHPPLHIWLVGAWMRLTGSEAAFVVRLPFIALFAGSTWLMFRLTALLFGERAGLWAAVALNVIPSFTLAAGMWVLPDGPLDFLLLAVALLLARLIFTETTPRTALLLWLAAGALAGLALLSKYHAALFLLGAGVFALVTPAGRRQLRSPGPWLGILIALAVFAPALVWNAQNGWVGLTFQSDRVAGATRLRLDTFLTSIGGQAGYLLPWLFVPMAFVLGRAMLGGRQTPQRLFLALLAIGPIVLFTAAALLARGLPHWQMPGWLFVVPLLGEAAAQLERTRPRLVARVFASTAIVVAAFAAGAAMQTATGWVGRLVAVPPRLDPTTALTGWDDLRAELDRRGLLTSEVLAAGAVWLEAGKISHALGPDTPTLCLCARPQHFAFRYPGEDFTGRTVLIAGTDSFIDREETRIARHFDRIEELAPVQIGRGASDPIMLRLIRGTNYRP